MIDWTEEKLIEEGYKIENAKIVSVDLSTADYACADLRIVLEGNGWGTVFGGYKLAHAGTYINRGDIIGNKKGFEAILNIMWTLESDSLVGLECQYIRVATKGWGNPIKIIGHITKDQWFDYGSFFENIEDLKEKKKDD